MRAILLMDDAQLASSLERFLGDFHSVDSVVRVTDVDSAIAQLAAAPTDWLLIEPDSLKSEYTEVIQELISTEDPHLQMSFVISSDVRWATFSKISSKVEYLKKPFTLTALNEVMMNQSSWIERRQDNRVYPKNIVFGQVILENGEELDIVFHNISTSGCLLHADAQKTGLAVYDTLQLFLPHDEPIVLLCKVIRVQAYDNGELNSGDKFVLVGVRFDSVDGDMEMLLADYIHNFLE